MLFYAGGGVSVRQALGPRGVRLHAEAGPKRRQELELLRIADFHALHIAPRGRDRQCLVKSHTLKNQRPVLGLNKALDALVEQGGGRKGAGLEIEFERKIARHPRNGLRADFRPAPCLWLRKIRHSGAPDCPMWDATLPWRRPSEAVSHC